MSIIDYLTACVAPHDCLLCGKEGALLCGSCWQAHVQRAPQWCYRCHAVSEDGRTCRRCQPASNLYSVRAVTIYDSVAKALVWRLKFSGAQAAAQEMAVHMSSFSISARLHVVAVPTATGRVRRRGYDQARLLAKEFSKHSGLPHLNCLARRAQIQQVGSSREQRLHQLSDAFYVPHRFQGTLPAEVVLIDDVVTTGATLEAAARTLKNHGVVRVKAITFARA